MKIFTFIIILSGLFLHKSNTQYRVWLEPLSPAYSSIHNSYPGITGSLQFGWRYCKSFSSSISHRFSYSTKNIDFGKRVVWAKSTQLLFYINPLDDSLKHQIALGIGPGLSSYKYATPTYIFHDPLIGFNPCFAIEYKYAVKRNMYVGIHHRIYGEGDGVYTHASGISLGIIATDKTKETPR